MTADLGLNLAGVERVLRLEEELERMQDRIEEIELEALQAQVRLAEEIETVLAGYPSASEVVWLQEEPENMGAWPFAHHQLHRVMRDRLTLRHVARAESASPATGSGLVHQAEQADLLDRAIGER